MIDGLCGERLPAIDLAHVDLAGGEQGPEQHDGGVCTRQHGLRLDPSFELLVQPLDRIGRARVAPLVRRQSREGEQPIAGFLQAVGDGAVLEPPLADEGLAAGSIRAFGAHGQQQTIATCLRSLNFAALHLSFATNSSLATHVRGAFVRAISAYTTLQT